MPRFKLGQYVWFHNPVTYRTIKVLVTSNYKKAHHPYHIQWFQYNKDGIKISCTWAAPEDELSPMYPHFDIWKKLNEI